MDKLMIFMKRKPGLSFEEFRDRYEATHVPLGLKHFGHLFKSYTRNYLTPGHRIDGVGVDAQNEYDVVTELVFKDPDGYEQLRKISMKPGVQEELSRDRDDFMLEAEGYNAKAEVVTTDLGVWARNRS